jgi:hypothetical protein
MVGSDDIGAEVASLLAGPTWSGHRVTELGSIVSADEVAAQLGEVLILVLSMTPFQEVRPQARAIMAHLIPMGYTTIAVGSVAAVCSSAFNG